MYSIVVLIGALQIIGYVIKIEPIKHLGILTASSPLPIVFTEVDGMETFVNDFYIQWKDEEGQNQQVEITPEIYSRLKGPYNRRNIFGAAIAYGPILPEEVSKTILRYGLCNGILAEELQLPLNESSASICIKTKTKGRSDEWTITINCNE